MFEMIQPYAYGRTNLKDACVAETGASEMCHLSRKAA